MKGLQGGKRVKSSFNKIKIHDVSIITIVFNEKDHIEDTIKSVLSQSNDNDLEYIIIDGGSTDGTLEVIKKYDEKIDYWISEPDKGISDAFNKGIRAATGKIIGMVNANDWYETDAIMKVLTSFNGEDIIYGDVQFWDGPTKKNKTNSDHQKLRTGMTVAHPAVFMKKEVYEKYGLFDTQYKVAMDYALLLKLYNSNVKFKKIDKVLVNMSTGGLSDTHWFKGVKEERKIKDIYFNRWMNFYFYFKQILYFNYKKFKN